MTLEQRIEQDLKTALLAHDAERVSTLRQLKSVLLNVKVATGKRESGLGDDEVIDLLSKEAKKRQESADLYTQGGAQAKADAELAEKTIIETYLPAQLSETELATIVDIAISDAKASGQVALGPIIGQVKKQTAGTADGALIARLVKERLDA